MYALQVIGNRGSHLCLNTNMSFTTASKAIKILVLLGIVIEYTKQHRKRIFVYNEYLQILNKS